MKIKKRVTIVANVLVDEDFDCDYLCICQNITDQTNLNSPEIFVGRSGEFEVIDYVEQFDEVIEDEN